jgi:putative SOS response-associated peptidase YedK
MIKKFLLASNLQTIENKFHFHLNDYTQPIEPSYKIGCNDSTYVVTCQNPHEIVTMRFGYTPHWSKKQMDILNAKAEGNKNPTDDPYYDGAKAIFQNNAFKRSIQTQRCLVFADAVFAFNNQNKPYLVYLEDKVRPFAMAGLYDHWKNPETNQIQTGFAIITTTANELFMQMDVPRMPVILPVGRENDWLKTDRMLSQVLGMLNEYSSEKMNAYPVSDQVLNSEINDLSLVKPVGERLQQIVRPQPVQPRQYWQSKAEKKHKSDVPFVWKV